MNESMNQSSVPKTAHSPLKIFSQDTTQQRQNLFTILFSTPAGISTAAKTYFPVVSSLSPTIFIKPSVHIFAL